jgi:acetyltransferase-like isoleucine patch superfamily enzyme
VSIGSRTILGAGAVAVEDIGDDMTCVGVPARPVDSRQRAR